MERIWRWRLILGALIAAMLLHGTVAAAPAQPAVVVRWDARETLPLVNYGALRLPMKIVAFQVAAGSSASLGSVQATPGSTRVERAANAAPGASEQLPSAPLVELARGIQRGEHVLVLGISPVYAQNGVVMRASSVEARIPNARPLDSLQPFFASGQPDTVTAPPVNPVASQQAVKITVASAGIQQLGGAGLPAFALANLRLYRNGTQVPLDLSDANGNSLLDAGDTLRFYAPTPGDRWNTSDTYWLTTIGTGAPLRVAASTPAAGNGTPQTTALERGTWRAPKIYNSLSAGPDGDHYFADELTSFTDFPVQELSATIAPALPRLDGVASYTLHGAIGSRSGSTVHLLNVSTGAASTQLNWSGASDWSKTVSLQQAGTTLVLSTVNAATFDSLLPDAIDWTLPVSLQFGGTGATTTTPNSGRYQFAGLPQPLLVYDITDPAAPQRLNLPDASTATFDSAASRSYLVAGAGTLFTPAASVYTPPDLSAALNAQVLYVAPAEFHAALAPLVALRAAQGYRVALVDPQALYDTWSYGQVAPEAIRSFFRAAYVQGNGALVSAVLVGDGTNDPFDYTRKPGDEAANNVNIIPPYLATVDPWLGETACETCYAQLDGDTPTGNGLPANDTLPDIGLGRLPAHTSQQVADMAAKIVRYETNALQPAVASRMGFVSDNYHFEDDSTDLAGDFYSEIEDTIALQPPQIRIRRMFYDPLAPSGDSEREPNALRAYQRTRELMNEGAAIVTYTGHGHYFQWAVTNLDAPTNPEHGPGYLFSLYDPDTMTNGDRLPIVLEMTCLTGAFQQPSFYSTSIDERLMLKADGGAAAVWGSSGAGVVYGHDALQEGFYAQLWSRPAQQARLGELTQAGYRNLLTTEPITQASIRTFLLLGDPLTPARVVAAQPTFLPLAGR